MQETLTDRLINLITDPLFWIVTILIGLVVSVIGNYATRISDRILSIFSIRIKQSRERENEQINEYAKMLMDKPQDRFDAKLDIIYSVQKQIYYFLSAILFLLLSLVLFIVTKVDNTLPVYKYILAKGGGLLFIIIGAIGLIAAIYERSNETRNQKIIRKFYQFQREKEEKTRN